MRQCFYLVVVCCLFSLTSAQTPKPTLPRLAKPATTAKKPVADTATQKPLPQLADTTQKPVDSLKPVQPVIARADTISPQLTINKPEFIPVADTSKIPVLDFKNTDIRDILRAIGMQYNVNMYLEPEVTGSLSFYLTNIPVKQAIDFVVKRGNFSYMVDKSIVKVYKFKEAPVVPQKPPVVFKVKDGILETDLKGVSIKDVAKLFVDSADVNVVVDAKLEKDITSHIKGLKVDKALKVICESNDLDISSSDGIYYIAAKTWGTGTSADGKTDNMSQAAKRLSVTVSKDFKVTLEVNNASLDQVIRSIALQSGINVIMYENVTGTVTAKFDSLTIDDVLRFLLQNTKYTFWKDKDIYFMGSREMSQQKTTLVIPLKHIMASEEAINKVMPPNILKDAVIKFDKEHNSLIIIGSFDVVAQTQEFIEKIDKFVPQVLIEALVVDFNLNKIKEYGVTLFTQGSKDTASNWLSEQFLPNLNLKPGQQRMQRVLNTILRAIGVNQILDLPSNFRATIQALESASIIKVHSTPQIATINGNQASIVIGETRYYKLKKETASTATAISTVIGTDERFEVIKFNTQLDITPWVMDDGYVMVKIRPEFNIPRTSGDATTPPNVDTRVIESMVRLKNGQTIVLGGQRQTENVVNRSGVPILSSIPVLGWLFSSQTISQNETQMMIFLTPHVYYKDDNAVSPDDYFGKEVNDIIKTDNDKKKKWRWFWEKKEKDTNTDKK